MDFLYLSSLENKRANHLKIAFMGISHMQWLITNSKICIKVRNIKEKTIWNYFFWFVALLPHKTVIDPKKKYLGFVASVRILWMPKLDMIKLLKDIWSLVSKIVNYQKVFFKNFICLKVSHWLHQCWRRMLGTKYVDEL